MNLTVDMSSDYLVWDNTEQVNLISHQFDSPRGGGDQGFTIPVALRRAAKFSEIAKSGGKYTAKDVVFLLPAPLVDRAGATGDREPKAADFVVDEDGVRYVVLDADFMATRSTWKLTTRDIVLAYGLTDTITLRRYPYAVDVAGAKDYSGTPTVVASGVLAAIHDEGGDESEERGKRVSRQTFQIHVAVRLFPEVLDQVVDQDGNVYEVKSWQDTDQLAELMTLRCEKRGW